MSTRAENDLMTRIGPGSAAGGLLREYWQPVALSEELDPARPVLGLRLMGEDLVLFRDEHGRLGLMERGCPHRGADLCFGRLEQGGLRCPFHGWLFDVTGQCLEQPAEPSESRAYQHMRHRAYACEERSGIIFAYLGSHSPPAFPHFDCFCAPDAQTFAFKGLWDCNWLQALEVGIDPAHASYLHRFLEDEPAADAYGRQFRSAAADSGVPLTKLLREYPRPTIRTEDTDFGFRLVTTRALSQGFTHYRITNLVFPNAIVIPMSSEMTITQWHVPIDDVSCYWYSIFTSFGAPVDRGTMRRQRLENHQLPSYRPKVGRESNWGFNADEQLRSTYTGMGMDINVHDQWAVESPGPIFDRSKEHLGKSDVGIIRYRKLLQAALKSTQEGKPAPFVFDVATAERITGPVAVDAIGPADNASDAWLALDRQRRARCHWAQPADAALE
jgi:nitrite reductase/ring-hydroxylating ferredoxin subunit